MWLVFGYEMYVTEYLYVYQWLSFNIYSVSISWKCIFKSKNFYYRLGLVGGTLAEFLQ